MTALSKVPMAKRTHAVLQNACTCVFKCCVRERVRCKIILPYALLALLHWTICFAPVHAQNPSTQCGCRTSCSAFEIKRRHRRQWRQKNFKVRSCCANEYLMRLMMMKQQRFSRIRCTTDQCVVVYAAIVLLCRSCRWRTFFLFGPKYKHTARQELCRRRGIHTRPLFNCSKSNELFPQLVKTRQYWRRYRFCTQRAFKYPSVVA